MDPQNIVVSIADGIAHILLNRPERRNALSIDLLRDLHTAVQAAGRNQDVRVVVLSGAGSVFSSGHDLSEMIGRERVYYDELFSLCTDVMAGIQHIRQPVIAQVHGMATAAGCQLVAACDLAIATEDSRFATPGVKIGLFCSTPMVPLSRAIGRKRALQMLLTGEPIDAATAVDWALINAAVPLGDLENAVQELSDKIRSHSGEVIGIGKAAFYAQVSAPDDAAYAVTGPIMSDNAGHVDAQEGMQAFLDKRLPDWPSQR